MNDDKTDKVAPAVPKEIVAAVMAVRSNVKSLKKDDKNIHGGYTYVSIDSYYENIVPIANKAGLVWRTREASYDLLKGQGKNHDRTHVRAHFIYDLFCGAAVAMDYMEVTIISPTDGAQTTGQLFSYADKVFMRVAFGVSTGEKDADANDQQPMMSKPASSPSLDPKLDGIQEMPTFDKGNGALDTHDLLTGEVTPPAVPDPLAPNAEVLAPKKNKTGDPIIDTRQVGSASAELVFQIFRTWLPTIKTKTQLTNWYAENLPTIEKVKTFDPTMHESIKEIFNGRMKEINATTKENK